MLVYGEKTVTDWIYGICYLSWKEGRVPEEWTNVNLVTIYNGKGDKSECGNYRRISRLRIQYPGNVYCKILIEITEKNYKGQSY